MTWVDTSNSYHTNMISDDPGKEDFRNIVGKSDNTGNKHFHLFHNVFLLYLRGISVYKPHFVCHLQMLSIWTCLQFFPLVKGYALLSQSMTHTVLTSNSCPCFLFLHCTSLYSMVLQVSPELPPTSKQAGNRSISGRMRSV